MRKGLLLILAVLLLLVLLTGLARVTGVIDPAEPAGPVALDPEVGELATPPDLEPGAPPSESSADKSVQDVSGEVALPSKEELSPAELPKTTGTAPETAASPPPAFKRSPRTPPPPKPGLRSGGGRPPMGPTGLWERFPPEIPKGTASIRVRVVDRDGAAVVGADVWLGPPEIAGSAAVSFGDLRKAGVTDSAGSVTAENLPAGSAAVAANVGNLLNGRRGLDAASAVRTVLISKEIVEVEVRLPIAVGDYGTVHGIVTGPEDLPLSSVSVTCGFNRARTAADGRFELRYLKAGSASLSAGRSGYRSASAQVSVVAGESREFNVSLEYREEGSLRLGGTVVGPDGAAVPGARVYVMTSSGRGGGTVRSGVTDEHGQFDFRSLPDRLATANVRIQASRRGYRAGNVRFEAGLKESEVEVVLPIQLTKLRLTVVDASTGAPQTRCRFAATKEGADRRAASFSSRSNSGIYETWLEPGPHALLIEAPDHEPMTTTLDVPEGGGDPSNRRRSRSWAPTEPPR